MAYQEDKARVPPFSVQRVYRKLAETIDGRITAETPYGPRYTAINLIYL